MKSILPKTIESWKVPISPAYFEAKDETEKSLKIAIIVFGWTLTTIMIFLLFASGGFGGQFGLNSIVKSLAASAFMSTFFIVFFWLIMISRYLRPTIYLNDRYIQIAGLPNNIISKGNISGYFFTTRESGGNSYDCFVVVEKPNKTNYIICLPESEYKAKIIRYFDMIGIQQIENTEQTA